MATTRSDVKKMLAKTLPDGRLMCTACQKYCRISDGEAGFCGVRFNENGKLNLTVYGRPCAIWNDPIEKKPLFHFLPGSRSFSLGTYGCNFGCDFCQNWDISQAPKEIQKQDPKRWKEHYQKLVEQCDEWPPEKVVDAAVAGGCKSISFTYNEPTIFTEYAIDIMKLARKRGLRGVYVTNGYESTECWDALKGMVDAVNIDLKAYNNKFYTQLCKAPGYEPVKRSIEYAKKLGFWVEITTLFIPDWNDKESEIKELAEFLASVDPEMPWHATAFYPMYKLLDKPPTPPETLVRAREIGKMMGLKHVYCGNIPRTYSDSETTICNKCEKELIKRTGFDITENNAPKGKCKFCKTQIAGVWE